MKTNQKLGGINWIVNSDAEGLPASVFNEHTLILGSNLYHSPNIPNHPSIATIVGWSSTTLDSGNYFNRVLPIFFEEHDWKTRHIKGLHKVLKGILMEYREKNKALPKRIIYYRTGKFNFKGLGKELNEIQEGCSGLLYEGDAVYQPLISVVRCSKQNHMQGFKKVSGEILDCGTVIDSLATSSDKLEFYLKSGTKGCPPCRYTIFYDDSQFTTDEWEMLSFYLCHFNPRSSKVLGIPAPVMHMYLSSRAARAKLEACDIDWANPPSTDELIRILEPSTNQE